MVNMSENTNQLSVKQQLLVSAAADEILESTNIHQQTLVRMLAVASEHNLNAANLLEDLSVEMKSATARDIPLVVSDLRSGTPVESALAAVPGVVPESVVMALDVAQSQGLQKPLNQALLSIGNRRNEIDHQEDTTVVSKLIGLFQRYVFTICILTFMMLFIIPQFKDMFEEFGIDMPISMELLVELSDLFTKLWFVPASFILAFGLFLVLKRPHLFVSYFIRWIPNRWQQPVLTKSARKDRSFAWVVRANDDSIDAAIRFVSSNGIGVKTKKRIAAAKKIESGTEVLDALTTERVISKRASDVVSKASSSESASWLLRRMSGVKELKRHYRNLAGVRLLIWVGDFILMVVAGLTAISIFQCLITIIQGLTS